MDEKLIELRLQLNGYNSRRNYSSYEYGDDSSMIVCTALGNSLWSLNVSTNDSCTILLCRNDNGPNNYRIRFYAYGNDVSIIDDHNFSGSSLKQLFRRRNNSFFGYRDECMLSDSQSFNCQICHCDAPEFILIKSNPNVWKVNNSWKIPQQFFRKNDWTIKNSILLPTYLKHCTLTVEFKNRQFSFKFEKQITEDIFIGGKFSIVKENPKYFFTFCKVGSSNINVFQLPIPNQEQEFYFCYELLLFKEFTSDIFSSISNETSQTKPTVSLLKSLSRDIASIYTDGSFSDVKVRVGQKVFNAHQVILCARSPVFKAMLEANMAEKNSKVIQISDLDAQSVEIMLMYIYSGEANIDVAAAKKLYYAGDKYQMGDLKDACSAFLKSNLTLRNAFQILIMADNHSDEDLKTAVQNFICVQKGKIFESETWNQFIAVRPLLAAKTMQFYLKNKGSS